jgi:O-antigen/teichoic acid export membrane protein
MSAKGFGNIILRIIVLISKFLFVFFLGKYSLNKTDLGEYGLLVSTIAFLIYFLGFDFYVFNTREILNEKSKTIAKVVNQFFFHLVTYIVFIPIILFFVFGFNFLETKYLYIFILLIISEHLSQELFRLYTSLESSLKANFILFVRSSIWIWYVFFDYFILKNPINLLKYFTIWTFFSWISVLIGVFFLLSKLGITSLVFNRPDYKWIFAGLKQSSIFFLSSLCYLIIQLSDRYMISFYFNKELVGVYTTYAQFVNAIDIFTFSGITMIFFPKLIKNYSNKISFEKIKKEFSLKLLISIIVLILCSYLIAPHIYAFLEKDLFLEHISSYNILLVAVFFLVMSNVFHYDLYAKRKDKLLFIISLIAMVINFILNLFFIPKYGVFGASITTFLSFLIIFILKLYFSRKYTLLDDNIRPNS